MHSNVRSGKKKWIIIAVLAIMIILLAAFGIYTSRYYHADEAALAAFSTGSTVTASKEGNMFTYSAGNPDTGLVFYPGGKVEYTAYEPLMKACTAQGMACTLIKMPFNLAVLDMNAADGIQERYPEIERWYIGGHSLGASMAASYAAKHPDEWDGVILLGSYSTANLAETGLDVLSVYGSEDKVLNADKYEKYKVNLPKDFSERIIDGACHAGFGLYGPQAGDGIPSITNEEQVMLTADIISEFIGN